MTLEFDEKGKIFTKVITKVATFSQIQTLTHYIRGYIHVRQEFRLSDEINQATHFIAVTCAEICTLNGEILQTVDFLALNKEHIIWLMPLEDPRDRSD
jgi:hypothetical protein